MNSLYSSLLFLPLCTAKFLCLHVLISGLKGGWGAPFVVHIYPLGQLRRALSFIENGSYLKPDYDLPSGRCPSLTRLKRRGGGVSATCLNTKSRALGPEKAWTLASGFAC